MVLPGRAELWSHISIQVVLHGIKYLDWVSLFKTHWLLRHWTSLGRSMLYHAEFRSRNVFVKRWCYEALTVIKWFVLSSEWEGHIALRNTDMVKSCLIERARKMASHPCLPHEGRVWIRHPDCDCIFLDLVLYCFSELILCLDHLGWVYTLLQLGEYVLLHGIFVLIN